jgi:hypothetical protein
LNDTEFDKVVNAISKKAAQTALRVSTSTRVISVVTGVAFSDCVSACAMA